jgi:hypothetical protein
VTIKGRTSSGPDIQAIISPSNTEVQPKKAKEMRGMDDTLGHCALKKSGMRRKPIEKRRLL